MSESRAKLEQILELLLSEQNEKAEEMLHEYVVAKARAEYERVLDESEEEVEVEETIDQSNDFETDILADEGEIEADEAGLSEEGEDEAGEDEAGEEGEGEEGEGEEEGDEDLEDKVDDLEAELEDLRAEFEKLMAGDEGEEGADMGMDDAEMADMEAGDENMMDSVEYDLDEEVDEEDGEVVEEATKLQNSVAAPKAPAADASNGTSPVAKHKAGWETGAPVKAKDGSEGDKGANKAKDHTPTSNIGIKPAKVNVPKA